MQNLTKSQKSKVKSQKSNYFTDSTIHNSSIL